VQVFIIIYEWSCYMNSLKVFASLVAVSSASLIAMQSGPENAPENTTGLNTPLVKLLAYISTIRAFDYDTDLRAQEFRSHTEDMNNGSCASAVKAHLNKKLSRGNNLNLPVATKEKLHKKGQLSAEIKNIPITKSLEELLKEQICTQPANSILEQPQNPITVSNNN